LAFFRLHDNLLLLFGEDLVDLLALLKSQLLLLNYALKLGIFFLELCPTLFCRGSRSLSDAEELLGGGVFGLKIL